jgi:hypothetical protein
MNLRKNASFLLLALFALALLFAGYGQTRVQAKGKGLKSSDPQYDGPLDTNYDHVIVPGQRIGPVQLGASVRDALRHLGNPDSVGRFVCGGIRPCPPDQVFYWYTKNECLVFSFTDKGLDPIITGVTANCDKWSTRDGLHVGFPMPDLANRLGEYCPVQFTSKGHIFGIFTKEGIDFRGKNRNSPVTEINVAEARSSWNGMCRD